MDRVFKLINRIKHYDWGSPEWIPRLLGRENPEGKPWAELWMGVHPEGPSELLFEDRQIPLSRLLRDNPAYLGSAAPLGTLPFLYKLLAAARPLSIQAHPDREQARSGWERENLRGIPPDAPERNYRDSSHKPEILCALSPFKAMCGFREPEHIRFFLEAFVRTAPASLRKSMTPLEDALKTGGDAGLRAFLEALFDLPGAARESLGAYAARFSPGESHPESRQEWELVAYFAGLYPRDPAILSPLYLNLIKLDPGQAIYLPAGVLHAYVYGLGVELMASSDNVLRGGLTPKHIDIPELTRILMFSPFMPEILDPAAGGGENPDFFRYPAPCGEFSLSRRWGGGKGERYAEEGPSIVLLTEGRALLSRGGASLSLEGGESAFIAAGTEVELKLRGTLYAAALPPGSGKSG
jgi:mannose-6-phosphate isomerase